jgi:hypothetical protein
MASSRLHGLAGPGTKVCVSPFFLDPRGLDVSDTKTVDSTSAGLSAGDDTVGASEQPRAQSHAGAPALTARFLVPFTVIWLAVTLPILRLGYGSDPDSWLVARVGEIFWTQHEYHPSRSSGFPLYEMAVAPLVHTGHYWAPNAFSLLGAAALLASLVFLSHKGKLRHPHLVLTLVAFLPVILKNATCTVDYVITLSILAWAYVAMDAGKLTATILLVGVACGFRPQAVIYFGPVCLYIYLTTRSFRRTALLGLLGGAVAFLCYSPVLLTHGLLTGYKDYALGVSGQILMLGYNGLQVLGIIPTLLIAGIVVHVVRDRRRGVVVGAAEIPHLRFHLAVFGVYGVVFAAMPHEPEYLLPALFSLVLVLDAILDRRLMVAALCAALSYHAFRIEAIGGASANRKLALSLRQGYLARDISVRRFLLSTREALTRFTPDRPTLFMFGCDWATPLNPAWEEAERFVIYRKKGTDYYVSDALHDYQVKEWRAKGVRVVLWRGFAKDFLALRPADDWRDHVDVIDSLEDYLGAELQGQPMWPSE